MRACKTDRSRSRRYSSVRDRPANYAGSRPPASRVGDGNADRTGTDDTLVATLSDDSVVTTLGPGRTTVSVPRGVGEAALEVTFARRGDTVFVLDRDTVVGSIH